MTKSDKFFAIFFILGIIVAFILSSIFSDSTIFGYGLLTITVLYVIYIIADRLVKDKKREMEEKINDNRNNR